MKQRVLEGPPMEGDDLDEEDASGVGAGCRRGRRHLLRIGLHAGPAGEREGREGVHQSGRPRSTPNSKTKIPFRSLRASLRGPGESSACGSPATPSGSRAASRARMYCAVEERP